MMCDPGSGKNGFPKTTGRIWMRSACSAITKRISDCDRYTVIIWRIWVNGICSFLISILEVLINVKLLGFVVIVVNFSRLNASLEVFVFNSLQF